MPLIPAIASSLTVVINAIEQVEKNVNNYYKRKDMIDDIKLPLEILKHNLKGIQNQLPLAESVVATNAILAESLRLNQIELQTYYNRVFLWKEKMVSAGIIDRVRRMNEIVNDFEKIARTLVNFFNDKVSPLLTNDQGTDLLVPITNVPQNPPRLTFDFSSKTTNEGKLKRAILDQKEGNVISIIVSGKEGTGKTCALCGLVDDTEIKQRFTGGILYISLGYDAKKSDIIRGLAEIVYQTGGTHLSRRIKAVEKVQDACNLASRWFSSQTYLFLVDDLWNVNGIDKNVINELGGIVHNRSRMVYTSRDEHFLDLSQSYINFEVKEANGEIARTMLRNHSSFSEEEFDSLEQKNIAAFEDILSTCQGLPLALGIMGGSIRSFSQKHAEHSKQNVWSEFWHEMERFLYVNECAGQVQQKEDIPLRRIIDLSLKVLEDRQAERKFPLLFRALSVIRKQQSVPITVLHKIWGFKTFEETKEILEQFSNVSLVQLSKRDDERISLQLHDLVLDIAQHEAGELGEIQRFHDILIKNYSSRGGNIFQVWHQSSAVGTDSKLVVNVQDGRKGQINWPQKVQGFPNLPVGNCLMKGDRIPVDNSHESSAVEVKSTSKEAKREERKGHFEWWDITEDGYIHDNICKLLHRGGKVDELLWLLSQPEWVVYRSLNGGVLQVNADLNEGITALGESNSLVKQREHLQTIGKAVRLSRPYVCRNANEVWFQLYGRLQWHATVNEWTERFIRSIERVAPRPWVKAPIGVLQQANLHSQTILETKGSGLCIRIMQDVIWCVWSSFNDGIGITSCEISADNERTVKLDTTLFEEMGVSGISGDFYASFSTDGMSVIVVHSSRRIGTFKTATGELEKHFRLENHSYIPRRDNFRCSLPSNQEETRTSQEQNEIVGISKCGKYVVTSNYEHDVQIWSVANGEAIGPPLRGHTRRVRCMTTDEDGILLVTGGDDNTIRVWNLRNGEAVGGPLCGHTNAVTCLTMSAARNQVVSGSADKSVRIWDIRNGTSLRNPSLSHKLPVWCVTMSEDGNKILSGSIDGGIMVWNVQDGVMKGQPLHGQTSAIYCVGMSRDGDLAASVSDRAVWVWNTTRNEGMGQDAVENEKKYRRGVMSQDGRRYMFKTGKHTAKVLDAKSGELVGSVIRIDIESMSCMGISGDDKRGVCGLRDGTLIVFGTMNGEKIGEPLRGHDDRIKCVAISEDGDVIVSASNDKTLRLWDTESDEYVWKQLVGHSDVVNCVALSADASRVVSGSVDTTVFVWDARSGEAIGGPLLGHRGSIQCVGLSADGTKAASGSDDCTVRVWDVESSQQIGGPFQHDSPVLCLGFDANISKIATICFDATQKTLDTESESSVSTLSSQQWNSEVNSLSWNGHFISLMKRIIDVDENSNETVLATTDILSHRPGSNVYFTQHCDPLILLR